MQIQNSSNINFQGGFRFPNMKTTAKNQLPELFKKGKQIFYDFEKKGDVFLLTRPEKDYIVAKFISKHKLKFEYYPEISTTTRALDSEIHEPLTNMLNELKPKKITNEKEMMGSIKERHKSANLEKSIKIPAVSPERLEADNRVLTKLGIDIPEAKHSMTDNVHTIVSKQSGEKVLISASSKNGFKYVMYTPKSIEEPVRRYAVTSDGMILAEFNTPTEIVQFKRNLNATIVKDA